MVNILHFVDLMLTNLLVLFGVLIIVSGAIKTWVEFIRYKKEAISKTGGSSQFPFLSSHLTFSIFLSIPLFIIKFFDDAIQEQSQMAYVYALALIVSVVSLVSYPYKKKKTDEKKRQF
jgi:uncharacterized membrane protein HdeD (DUF308 family)